jgi:hypothetical protein
MEISVTIHYVCYWEKMISTYYYLSWCHSSFTVTGKLNSNFNYNKSIFSKWEYNKDALEKTWKINLLINHS